MFQIQGFGMYVSGLAFRTSGPASDFMGSFLLCVVNTHTTDYRELCSI